MPLLGIPNSITPELLFVLARMGHGDMIVIADSNFPSDSTAAVLSGPFKTPIRVHGKTSDILCAILKLMPLDQYMLHPLAVMKRVESDIEIDLHVPAYHELSVVAGKTIADLAFIERFEFYRVAKTAFAVIQTDDSSLYANAIVYKGVIS